MKIVWISDLDVRGSGYANLSVPLCVGLHNKGHEVKILGLGYRGEEHQYPLSIIPAQNFQEIFAMLQNLVNMWPFDVLVVALDIPLQEQILHRVQQRPFKYVGIMPIEADPLCASWAMVLMWMDKPFIISEFGTEEAHKAGVASAEHIPIGLDTNTWRLPLPEERKKVRDSLFGVDDECFVILTVADNQERKNLAAGMEIFAKFNKEVPNSKYVLVTREHNMVGWKIDDYSKELGIQNNLIKFERGMNFEQLWSVYAGADCFLLPSKAEGLGLPLLEAMSVGLPCIATNATGMKELLSGLRGLLSDHEYLHRDPFGNGRRYWINKLSVVDSLRFLRNGLSVDGEIDDYTYIHEMIDRARRYVEQRTWDKAVEVLENGLKGVTGK